MKTRTQYEIEISGAIDELKEKCLNKANISPESLAGAYVAIYSAAALDVLLDIRDQLETLIEKK